MPGKQSLIDQFRIDESEGSHNLTMIFSGLKNQDRFSIYILFLGLLNCVPIPMPPGYSSIFGSLVMILAYQMVANFSQPKLPKFIDKRTISTKKLLIIKEKIRPILRWVEKYIQPKNDIWIISNQKYLGIFYFICGFVLFMPIPFGNIFSGISITICAVSAIEKNLKFFIFGSFCMLISAVVTFGILYLGAVTAINSFFLML